MQQVESEILPAGEAARVRESLDSLVAGALPGYPPSSIALMRAGYALRDGLYVDARRELLTALAKDPDEPTLHFLLGQVYESIGLGELAQREFIEARDLSPRSGGGSGSLTSGPGPGAVRRPAGPPPPCPRWA